MVLAQEGFRVLTADSGRQALRKAQRHIPDAIVLDCGLPEPDGPAVLEHLREDPRTAAIPVLMLTGRKDPKIESRCLALGAAYYLVKGSNAIITLPEYVRRALGRPPILDMAVVHLPGIVIDSRAKSVRVQGVPIHFTTQEFRTLRHIAAETPRVVPWRELAISVRLDLKKNEIQKSASEVASVINHIRNKLGPLRHYLVTERGEGVAFRPA